MVVGLMTALMEYATMVMEMIVWFLHYGCTTSVRKKMWCYCNCYCGDRRCYCGACTQYTQCTQCTVRMAHSDACVVPTATATVVTEDSTGVAAQCTMHSAQ